MFIRWDEALRFFTDYVSDSESTPLVAQLGDTWVPYFRSLGVVDFERWLV